MLLQRSALKNLLSLLIFIVCLHCQLCGVEISMPDCFWYSFLWWAGSNICIQHCSLQYSYTWTEQFILSQILVEHKVRSVLSFKRKLRFWSKAQWSEIKSLQVLAAENGTLSTNSSDLWASDPKVRYLGLGDETSLQRHFQSMWKPGVSLFCWSCAEGPVSFRSASSTAPTSTS